ncbi:MAG: hypothetical protein KME30_31845 [Iphinoe sp. HA4291-MV1]|jgi:hypothetical protein|nr:hypothetical protein [Iphinoe sp. HA4291-MV1]
MQYIKELKNRTLDADGQEMNVYFIRMRIAIKRAMAQSARQRLSPEIFHSHTVRGQDC